jgi:hypothetical protein
MAGRDEQVRKQKRVNREEQSENPERESEVEELPGRQQAQPGRGISPTDPAEGPREDVETTNNPDEQNTGD